MVQLVNQPIKNGGQGLPGRVHFNCILLGLDNRILTGFHPLPLDLQLEHGGFSLRSIPTHEVGKIFRSPGSVQDESFWYRTPLVFLVQNVRLEM